MTTPMVAALRLALAVLGGLMVLASRINPRFRRQVTRDLAVEISLMTSGSRTRSSTRS